MSREDFVQVEVRVHLTSDYLVDIAASIFTYVVTTSKAKLAKTIIKNLKIVANVFSSYHSSSTLLVIQCLCLVCRDIKYFETVNLIRRL